jgi:hypothetical protein
VSGIGSSRFGASASVRFVKKLTLSASFDSSPWRSPWYDPGSDVERADAGVDDAARAGDAALIRDAAAVDLLVDARVELRLARALVLERRAERAGPSVG